MADEMTDQAEREMPRYQSHKKVWALKIAKIEPAADGKVCGPTDESDGTAFITPEEEGYGRFLVDREYMNKHRPQVGGYFVQYEGGYKSWSPADAFESGYTRI